jgi:hypothetical protein
MSIVLGLKIRFFMEVCHLSETEKVTGISLKTHCMETQKG